MSVWWGSQSCGETLSIPGDVVVHPLVYHAVIRQRLRLPFLQRLLEWVLRPGVEEVPAAEQPLFDAALAHEENLQERARVAMIR